MATYGSYRGEVLLAQDQWQYSIPLTGLKLDSPEAGMRFWERHLVFVFGCVGLAVGLALAIAFPKSSRPDLYKWFAILFALSAGGVASEIPGFLDLKMSSGQKFTLAATGAIAVFVILFFFNPA